MKSIKLGGDSAATWTWENAVAKESIDLSNVNSRYDTVTRGVQISDDGHDLYVGFPILQIIAQFYLSDAGDLTTITTTVKEKNIGHNFYTFKIAKDGTRLYIGLDESNENHISQHDFSTAWDISSVGTQVSQYAVTTERVYGIDVSVDGSQMYASDYDDGAPLYVWSMPTPFEMAGGSQAGPVPRPMPSSASSSINFSSDGKRLISPDGYQGDFDVAWDIFSPFTPDPLCPYEDQGNFYWGMDVTNDGKNAFCNGYNSPTVTRVELAPGGSYGKSIPVADAGDNQYEIVLDATVQLDGSGSYDTNTPPKTLSYVWSLPTIPGGSAAVLSDPNIVNPTFVLDVEGDYIASLVVSNGVESSFPSTTTVTSSDSGVLARYWGIKSVDASTKRIAQLEFLSMDNGMSVSQFDTASVIYDITSYGHRTVKTSTDRDWGTTTPLNQDTFLKYDCGAEQAIAFIRVGHGANLSEALDSFRVLKSNDDVNWYESDVFSGYSADTVNQFNSGNYIDVTNTNWTLI